MNYRKTINRTMLAAILLTAGSTAGFAQQERSSDKSGQEKTEETTPKEKTPGPAFAVYVAGGLTFSYTDVKPSKSAVTLGIGGTYHATPYLHVNLDIQKGWLKGGEPSDTQTGIMGSDNSFFTVAVTGRFLPLALIENKNNNGALHVLSGLYGGVGLGLISSSVTANHIVSGDYGSLDSYSGASLMLPIEAGINIPVAKLQGNKSILVNLNYRINLCFSDKVDGYVPTVEANKKNDAYNSLTAGIVFAF